MKLFLSQMMFECEYCEKRFGRRYSLEEHIKCVHEGDVYICHDCEEQGVVKTFNRKDNLIRHIRDKHGDVSEKHVCHVCNYSTSRKHDLENHIQFYCRPKPSTSGPARKEIKINQNSDQNFPEVETLYGGISKTYSANPSLLEGDLSSALSNVKEHFRERINQYLQNYPSLKFNIYVECEFFNMVNELCKRGFKTKQSVIYKTTEITPLLTQAIDKIKTEKSECELKGSGWCYRRVLRVELRVAKYSPLLGGSYIQLPDKIMNKKATINVLNVDEC